MNDDDDILAVAEAAAGRQPCVDPDGPPVELQIAIATAVLHGKPVREVAAVAQMTALEVVDAAEAVTYQANPSSP
ncbi:hypothetical protein [Arthrobacter sp. AD-310]